MATPDSAQRTTLKSKVLLGFGSVLAMLVIIATISVRSTRSFIRTAGWVANANEAVAMEERMLPISPRWRALPRLSGHRR